MSGGPVARVWRRLATVREVRLRARWTDPGGEERSGGGRGTVTVEAEEGGARRRLRTVEEGVWEPEPGRTLPFRTRHRWTLTARGLELEHLRRGLGRPVFLVRLVPAGHGELASRVPHVCGEDRYRARVAVRDHGVSLVWRIRGPEKRQCLESGYS